MNRTWKARSCEPGRLKRAAIAARVIHPFPTLANVLAVALFAAAAWRGVPPAGTLARLMAVMFCAQSAIGATNDAMDVELDRPAKPWKPIVCGALTRGAAWTVAGVTALVACLLAATFGAAAWALAMGGMACGLAYDLGLKRTRFSVAPYLVALPLLPLWVWTALGHFHAALLWVYPLGMLIGVSLYLGNTAPDIESDAAAGVRGTAHRIGFAGTLVGAWVALGAAIGLGVAVAALAGFEPALVLAAAGVATACLALAVLLSSPALRAPSPQVCGEGYCGEGTDSGSRGEPRRAALQRAWELLIAGSLVFGLGWLAAVR